MTTLDMLNLVLQVISTLADEGKRPSPVVSLHAECESVFLYLITASRRSAIAFHVNAEKSQVERTIRAAYQDLGIA